jgi:predicted DNA-binding protein (MmcQ/YjbR family)
MTLGAWHEGTAMAKRMRKLTPMAQLAFARVRKAAAALQSVDESTSFGNPTFRIRGTAFAVVDRYRGCDCLWLRVAASDREQLLKRAGWFPSPYDRKRAALCCSLGEFDWRRLRTLLRASYDLADPRTREEPK